MPAGCIRDVRKLVALLSAAGLVVAALVWLRFLPSRDVSESPNVAAPAAAARQEQAPSQRDLEVLRRTVEEERLARLALAERVDRMQAQLDLRNPTRETRSEADADRASEANEQASTGDAGRSRDDSTGVDGLLLDPAKLKGAGIDAAEADRLRQTYSEMWMERLQLRRLSERGEIEEQELIDEQTKLNDCYRAELGDEVYDKMLYAGDQENRVGVTDVMQGSQAQRVGVQPGDIILSYAGVRLFTPSDLVRATVEVDAGGTVDMVVIRGNEEHHLSVPGGPLGVVITEKKGDPHP